MKVMWSTKTIWKRFLHSVRDKADFLLSKENIQKTLKCIVKIQQKHWLSAQRRVSEEICGAIFSVGIPSPRFFIHRSISFSKKGQRVGHLFMLFSRNFTCCQPLTGDAGLHWRCVANV